MRLTPRERLFHHAVGIASVVLVAFAGGCKKTGTGTPDTTHPVDSTASTDTLPVAPDSAQLVILNKGITGLPDQDAATMAYLTGNTYPSPPEASEIIDEDVDCAVGTTHHYSHLKIRPVDYAHQIPWGKVASSGRSHLYAHIEVSKANCPNLGLLINEQGYLNLSGDGANNLVVEVYKKTLTGAVATGVRARYIKYCNTVAPTKPGTHLWQPVHCTGTATPYSQSRGTAMMKPRFVLASMLPTANLMAAFVDQGLWVSCSTGCCEVQF